MKITRVLFSILLPVLLFITTLNSCSDPDGYLPFYKNGELHLLKENPVRQWNQNGFFKPAPQGAWTNFFLLPGSQKLKEGEAFYVTYSSASPLSIEFLLPGNKFLPANLPSTEGRLRKHFLLLPGEVSFSQFRFKSPVNPGDSEIPAELYETGVDADPPGVQISEKSSLTGSGYSLSLLHAGEGKNFNIDFPGTAAAALEKTRQIRLILSLSLKENLVAAPIPVYIEGLSLEKGSGASAGKGNLSSGERAALSFELLPKEGDQKVVLYSSVLGLLPDRIGISGLPESRFFQVALEPVILDNPHPYHPLSGDLQTILDYPAEYWRNGDLEIFSWSLFPEVLILDFRDLAVQSSYLKRLAFFVEKKDFAGSIPAVERLDGLHGWNAHDYQAPDLARFFRKARAEGIPLTAGEEKLLEILLANGLVVSKGGKLEAGSGSILSLSKTSAEWLRKTFLVHESFHGIFFSDPVYRKGVAGVWNALSDEERWFWMAFLSSKDYDTSNPYLLINEFQAYILQQPVDEVNPYYWGYIIPNLGSNFPRLAPELDAFAAAFPDTFRDSAVKLGDLLGEIYGLTVSNVLSRTPIKRAEAGESPEISRR